MKALSNLIGQILEAIAKVVSLSVLVIAAVILLEIGSRMMLGVSLPWAHDVAVWLMCALIMLGGAWTLGTGKFVRVDALYAGFSHKTRLLIDTFVTTALLLALSFVLIKHGYTFAERAFVAGERPVSSNWAAPVWLFKALVPAGTSLMLLGWLGYLLNEWHLFLHPEDQQDADEEIQIHG